MMASIPNMRNTPLPVPTAKTAPSGDMPGDFAAQMPEPRGKPVQPDQPNVPQAAPPLIGGELTPLDIADVTSGEEGETPRLATKAGAPEDGLEIQMAAVMPFVQQPQIAPGPQVPLTVAAEETPPAQAAETNVQPPKSAPVQGTPVGRRSCGTGTGKSGAPAAALPEDGEDTPLPRELEAAVKELLQRKQVPARQVAAAPQAGATDTGKADAAAPQAQAQTQAQVPAPVAPVAVQAAAFQPPVELPQPSLTPAAPQPAPPAIDKAGAPDGTRTTDLAVERQLDLARDTEWLDRLARDIARAGANDQPLRFRLHPQTLGHMQVELLQGDHGTAVRLTVETEAARQILTDAQPRLTAEARAQGVRIAETHVDLSGSGRHAPGEQRRQDEARQTPFIRTARGAGEDAAASARANSRARLDRYA